MDGVKDSGSEFEIVEPSSNSCRVNSIHLLANAIVSFELRSQRLIATLPTIRRCGHNDSKLSDKIHLVSYFLVLTAVWPLPISIWFSQCTHLQGLPENHSHFSCCQGKFPRKLPNVYLSLSALENLYGLINLCTQLGIQFHWWIDMSSRINGCHIDLCKSIASSRVVSCFVFVFLIFVLLKYI